MITLHIQKYFHDCLALCKRVVRSKMADPLHDNDLEENSLRCVMKSPRFMVSNDLNFPSVTGCWPQKPLLLFCHPPSIKKDTTKKVHKPDNGINKHARACD